MRLRNVKNKEEILKQSNILIFDAESYRGKWQSAFEKVQPIHLEIGMGKGQFIIEMARQNPHINFIGIERYDSVIVRALTKVEYLPNLRLIRADANRLPSFFDHDITRIYLNFSDPWPKKRHWLRRLTSPLFLEKYDLVFAGNPQICQKTDNADLFQYSLLSLSQHGYILKELSFDLEHSMIPNVLTEYEERFLEMGCPIYYVMAEKLETKDSSL